jgi:hypothetical protein
MSQKCSKYVQPLNKIAHCTAQTRIERQLKSLDSGGRKFWLWARFFGNLM